MEIEKLQEFLNKSSIPISQKAPKTFLEIARQPHYENVISNIYGFFFDVNDLYDKKTRWNRISQYLIDLGLMDEHIDIKVTHFNRKHEVDYWKKEKKAYVINLLDIFISPLSYWTNNDKNIIWFDFNDMSKMEKWISEMIGKNFKMESVNSSKHVNCDIKLDEFFIEKYNSIYDYYDLPKNKKTLI